MIDFLIFIGFTAVILILMAKEASAKVWLVTSVLLFAVATQLPIFGWFSKLVLFSIALISLLGSISPIRKLITQQILAKTQKNIPSMSSTEREALEAGTVSWEGEIFKGKPDFIKLRQAPVVKLTKAEQAFLDGPVKTLCEMIDDWDITHNRTDLPEDMWQYIRNNRFFGMLIPEEYGGLGFSATAQMQVLVTLYGCSVSVATTVGVPNSLGPAELLLKYGTKDQRDYYLPRLANGTDIPCFALTGPNAGSDAASLPDMGTVCRGEFKGEEVIGIRLNWDKRYITLSPVATVIGLAFRMFDPENLLNKGEDIGITCALVPANLPGVTTGRRHFPMNSAFMNGPTQGKDVFIPLSYIIGGEAMAGHGWSMLMECLSAGRAISLPSSALGGIQLCTLASGAYARIRTQFDQPISKFEGIEEPLARIAGNTYIIDAGLTMAAAAIDQGEKPAIVGAILKYHSTERSRKISMDAMDIHGGKGICLGPENYMGRGYQQAPIGITVEGANILTRNLIIFGQGAIRCHPYIFAEMEAARKNDLAAFDKAFWGHVRYTLANLARSFIFRFSKAKGTNAPSLITKSYYQAINLYSANFAFVADFSLVLLGGALKRMESLSARLGDVLSKLYLLSAVLKRYESDGEPAVDKPIVDWAAQQLLYEIEQSLQGIIENFPKHWGRAFLKLLILPFGPKRRAPSDALSKKVAKLITAPCPTRDRLTRFVFKENIEKCPVGRMEAAFMKIVAVTDLEKKLSVAVRSGQIKGLTAIEQIKNAEKAGILSSEEIQKLMDAELARQSVVKVDDFDPSELRRNVVDGYTASKAKPGKISATS